MNKFKKPILSLVFLLPILISFVGGFEIERYNINIDVKQDGEIRISEEILVNFEQQRHGIIRQIPYIYDDYNISIYDLQTNVINRVDMQGGIYNIIIGNPEIKIVGEQLYDISYKVYGGILNFDDYQEFFWNIIGNQRDAKINNISFNINFYKPIDDAEWFAYYGYEGESNAIQNVGRNSTRDSFFGNVKLLNKYQGISVGIKLPSKYTIINEAKEEDRKNFVQGGISFDTFDFQILILSLLLPIMVILYIKQSKKNADKRYPIQYDIPQSISPAQAGMIERQSAKNADIIAIIYDLAGKGYIVIHVNKGTITTGRKENIFLEKIKDIDPGEDENSKELFHFLFSQGDKFYLDSFTNFKQNTGLWGGQQINPNTVNYEIMLSIIYTRNNRLSKLLYKKKTPELLFVLLFIFFVLLFLAVLIRSSLFEIWQIFIIFSIIISILMILYYVLLPQVDTDEGLEKFKYVKGFKRFLDTVESERLKQYIDRDPLFFDKILPYAIAFGLQNKLSKKFEKILQNYQFQGIRTDQNIARLGTVSIINSSIRTFNKNMSFGSKSGFSSGGGSGGSVGGGAGGGGGRSW